MRKASINRNTKETSIKVDINLDGTGKASIKTGIGFLDHMMEQIAKHSLIDIDLIAKGIFISTYIPLKIAVLYLEKL